MVLDLRDWPGSSAADPGAATGDVAEVGDAAGLDDFLAVMAGAYGWSDDGRSDAWAELYRLPLVDGAEPLRHVVVRDAGVPAACASVFLAGGHAFVTNVGTIPAARGRGLGTRATLAVLDIAARHGSPTATLTASRWAAASTPGSASGRTRCSGAGSRRPDGRPRGSVVRRPTDGGYAPDCRQSISRSLTETRP